MSRACKELNKIARRRADQLLQKRTACNRSAYPEFQKAWISTGLATIHKGQVCTRILANWRNPRPVYAFWDLVPAGGIFIFDDGYHPEVQRFWRDFCADQFVDYTIMQRIDNNGRGL